MACITTNRIHPGGRPSNYRREIGQQIADAMATGLSLEAAAASCGVGPRTAFTWQGQHEEFRQSVEEGRARSLLFWERRAIALASGEAGNAAVVTLGLKNRSRAASGWHDAQRLEHSGPDGGPVQQQVVRRLDVSGLDLEGLELLEGLLLQTMADVALEREAGYSAWWAILQQSARRIDKIGDVSARRQGAPCSPATPLNLLELKDC